MPPLTRDVEVTITITSSDTKFLKNLITFIEQHPKVTPGSTTISFGEKSDVTKK